MNTDLAAAARCFGVYDNQKIIAFIATLHQVHPIHKNLKRVSRLVVLPDYQGIGIGSKILDFFGEYWNNLHMDLCIDTSAKNLIASLRRNKRWRMYAYAKTTPSNKANARDATRKLRTDAYTGRFMYKNK